MSPACRDERGRGTKAAKHQRDGGNGNISSIHKTTSSKRKTLFLKNQCAPHPYAQRTRHGKGSVNSNAYIERTSLRCPKAR